MSRIDHTALCLRAFVRMARLLAATIGWDQVGLGRAGSCARTYPSSTRRTIIAGWSLTCRLTGIFNTTCVGARVPVGALARDRREVRFVKVTDCDFL